MIVADLHVHTTHSDGTLQFEEVPAVAAAAGLDAVAVTDHDRVQPALDGPVTERGGVTVVHGIELRVDTGTDRLDLLGYGVEPTESLTALCDTIQRNRIERAREIVDRVEARVDATLAIDLTDGVGRPHIARAIDEATEYTYQGAFDDLIGDGCPCYVPREIPSFDRGRDVLAEACGLVGLAHPFRYRDTDAALAACETLDAVEYWYPYDRTVDTTVLDAAIDRHGLVPTGGSDAHDRRLGRAGLDREAWTRFEVAVGV